MKEKLLENKKVIIGLIVFLLLSVSGLTLAYFVGQIGPAATANVNLTTKTVDNLTFTTGNDITIGPVNQSNFAQGSGNKSGSTTAKATLKANTGNNSATEHYNVYLKINNNNFEYTTANNTAELILKVTNPAGNSQTISGLTQVTSGGVTGYDITTKQSIITIASNYTITSTGTKTDTWTVAVYFINLNSDQQANSSKSFNAEIMIQSEEIENTEYTAMLAQEQLNDLKRIRNNTHDGVYYIDNEGKLDYGDGTKVNVGFTSDIPKGVVSYWNNEIIYACLNYDECNYEYDRTKTTVATRNLPCLTERGQNLLINGDLSYNNNTNLASFGTYNSSGYLSKTSNSSISESTDLIPVDPNKKYKIAVDMKASNTTANYYVGYKTYDADKTHIDYTAARYVNNTLTYLTRDLNQGDKTIYFNSLANWNNNTGTSKVSRGFIFWNYIDSTGYQYPELTYSKRFYSNSSTALYEDSAVDKTNNTITLTSDSGWAGPNIASGTKVSQISSTGGYAYNVLSNKKLTLDWVSYNGTVTGEYSNGNFTSLKFRPGTKFIKFLIWYNYNNTADTTTDIKNISITEIE